MYETAPHQSTTLTASPRGEALTKERLPIFAEFCVEQNEARGSLVERIGRGENRAIRKIGCPSSVNYVDSFPLGGSHEMAEYFCLVFALSKNKARGKLFLIFICRCGEELNSP